MLVKIRTHPMVSQKRAGEDRQAKQVDGVLLVKLGVEIMLLFSIGEPLQKVAQVAYLKVLVRPLATDKA